MDKGGYSLDIEHVIDISDECHAQCIVLRNQRVEVHHDEFTTGNRVHYVNEVGQSLKSKTPIQN